MTVNNGGNVSVTGTGVIHMASALATAPTDNIVVAAGGHIGQSGGSVDTPTSLRARRAQMPTTRVAAFSGSTTTTRATEPFFAVGGTFEVAGTGGGSGFNSSGQNFWNNVLIDSGVTALFDANVAMTINVGGNWTNNGAVTSPVERPRSPSTAARHRRSAGPRPRRSTTSPSTRSRAH